MTRKRNASNRSLEFMLVAGMALAIAACNAKDLVKPPPGHVVETHDSIPLTPEKEVDILFVIDNSDSMAQEQINLSKNFPKFIESLRSHKLGADKSGRPCTLTNQTGCKIPDVRIGVVSTDMGAGTYGLPSCEVTGGDGARLQTTARIAGCVPPKDPWISYTNGATNINTTTQDPIQQVKEAFSCIAELGNQGCGFEQTLESARRSLDPALNLNKGFLRKDAYLAVVFITDEDDCSAKKMNLFDPNQTTLNDPLGPLTSFRCFDFGMTCDINDRNKVGPRKQCRPSGAWLHDVDKYIAFFKGLKPAGRVIVSAISGPTDKVAVGTGSKGPTLMPSCQTIQGKAVPAIRIKKLVDAFGSNGQFSTICSTDFGPALRRLGDIIITNLDSCLSRTPLTVNGGVACTKGQKLGDGVSCDSGCLDMADCVVMEKPSVVEAGTERLIPRCSPALFNDPTRTSCGSSCPCWRLTPKASCSAKGPGLALQILRSGEPPRGMFAQVKCQASGHAIGSASFSVLPQCI